MSETPESSTSWPQRVRDAREDKDRAGLVYEQTIRDAKNIGNMSINSIARTLGIRDRTQITKYLGAEIPDDVAPVRLPVVLSLHGAGNSDAAWARMRAGIAARGWLATDDNSSWHLSRAGATTVHVNWPTSLVNVQISLVRAVHCQPADPPVTIPLRDYLPTRAAVRLMAEHPDLTDWPVEDNDDRSVRWVVVAERTERRPLIRFEDGGTVTVAADVDTILGRVAALIDQP
jgi:hypothetical protein